MGQHAATSAIFEREPGLARLRQRVASAPTLAPEEEVALAAAFQAGDMRAGEKLVTHNLKHVLSIALEYRRWGVPVEDLVQQGSIGLLHAARRFDPARAACLRTYAAYWVRAEIRDYVVRGHRIVRLGTTRTERRAMRAFRSTAVADAEELAERSGMPLARCELLWAVLTQRDRSLDAPTQTGTVARDLVPASTPDPETCAFEQEHHAQTNARATRALDALTERERCIVRARMMADEPETLDRLGARLGVSRERVRQLETRARQKMHDALAGSAAA
jgi:RNA polymerase sigma-32 factor